MSFLNKIKSIFSKNKNHQYYLELLNHCKQLNKTYSMISEKDQDEFSFAYLGLAYEFFIIKYEDKAYEVLSKVHKSNFVNLYDYMKTSKDFLVVGTVIYDKLKEKDEYAKNYFFQIFESKLKLNEIEFPEDEQYQFESFLTAWNNSIEPLMKTTTLCINKDNGEMDLKTLFTPKKD